MVCYKISGKYGMCWIAEIIAQRKTETRRDSLQIYLWVNSCQTDW